MSVAAQAASNPERCSMGTGGGTGSSRKVDKLRPYRIDYFIHDEMLQDKALVHSIVVRAVTAAAAKTVITKYASAQDYTVIRVYRFYKKLSFEPKVKKYIPIDKLLPARRAIEIMTEIENQRDRIIIRPEDLDAGHLQPPTTEDIDSTHGLAHPADIPPEDIPADILASFKLPADAVVTGAQVNIKTYPPQVTPVLAPAKADAFFLATRGSSEDQAVDEFATPPFPVVGDPVCNDLVGKSCNCDELEYTDTSLSPAEAQRVDDVGAVVVVVSVVVVVVVVVGCFFLSWLFK